jgi:pyrimidine-nucleoside phosphorylase
MPVSIAYLGPLLTIHAFIAAKRDGLSHSEGELRDFVRELTSGEVTNDQAAAWLMAAYIRGLDDAETTALTLAMADSGVRLDLSGLPHPVVDKHSTGGVGDAVTLLFLPLMAACGVPVVKMSGRGLGFTGGTLDKLESIPGFRTSLSTSELIGQANTVGCALGGQTADLAPADKKLYALRDATETIGSIPLIAASVMSKKLASGADAIVIDVKAGSGAFMKTRESAAKLARTLMAIGRGAGKQVRVFVSDMSQPLAPAVGNALEVKAAIREMKSGCTGRLGLIAVRLADAALELAGKVPNAAQAAADGSGIAKMREWFEAQGGDPRVVDDESLLPSSAVRHAVHPKADGIVAAFETEAIGSVARELGAGRMSLGDRIDHSVGIELHKALGDSVTVGDILFTVHADTKLKAERAAEQLASATVISSQAPGREPLLEEIQP